VRRNYRARVSQPTRSYALVSAQRSLRHCSRGLAALRARRRAT